MADDTPADTTPHSTDDQKDDDHKDDDLFDPQRLKRHTKFFERCLDVLPSYCQSLDTSRMTLLFFSLSGLDVLNSLDFSASKKKEIIDWIYAQQILPDPTNADSERVCGFRGSPFLGIPFGQTYSTYPCDSSHITMTYTALACLLVLGDDFSRVNKQSVIAGIKALQQEDGSFCSTIEGTETDMRFVYCACCVCYMLSDWSGVNMDTAVQYIKNSLAYDYGIGQGPGLESHGGSTFCAIASLKLMNRIDSTFTEHELQNITRWCIRRQVLGFQGRPNKPPDTCYSFWIGATLQLLGCGHLVNRETNIKFIFSTEGKFTGGFAKWPNYHPDPLHSYLGLCGLSLSDYPHLQTIHSALNISSRAAEWLTMIQNRQTNTN